MDQRYGASNVISVTGWVLNFQKKAFGTLFKNGPCWSAFRTVTLDRQSGHALINELSCYRVSVEMTLSR